MNTKLSVTAVIAFLAGLTSSQVYKVVSTDEIIEVVPDVHAEAQSIIGSEAEAVASALTSAETSKVTCQLGVIINHPTKAYCTDGNTAGFLLPDSVTAALGPGNKFELSTDINGQVYYLALE